MNERDMARFKAVFQTAGIPFTIQRKAVLDALYRSQDHPTADGIYRALVDEIKGISRTTIYRNLETLVRLGLANRLAHPGHAVRFDPNTETHHHTYCLECERVWDIHESDCFVESSQSLPSGFEVQGSSTLITGTCSGCRVRPEVPQEATV